MEFATIFKLDFGYLRDRFSQYSFRGKIVFLEVFFPTHQKSVQSDVGIKSYGQNTESWQILRMSRDCRGMSWEEADSYQIATYFVGSSRDSHGSEISGPAMSKKAQNSSQDLRKAAYIIITWRKVFSTFRRAQKQILTKIFVNQIEETEILEGV